MAFIAAGTFRMGSDAGDKDAETDEHPAHNVTLSAFCIDVTEVTVAAYRRCTQEAHGGVTCPSAPTSVHWSGYSEADMKFWSQFCNGDRADRNQHPINCVDWKAADTYCQWAGRTLPTEAQWEYAARGGKERRKYPWASNDAPGPTLLNAGGSEFRELGKRNGQIWPTMYEGNDGAEATAPVKSYAKGATSEGVYDMAGNVWEWMQDMKGDYTASPSTDPRQIKGTLRVRRGGGWTNSGPREVRAAYRGGLEVGHRDADVGFRCAREPNP